MNKRGIELSINFVVILILSIIIFSAGIYLTSKFYTFAKREELRWDEATRREIDKQLESGRVAVSFNRKKASNNQLVTFGVGVLNVLGIENALFRINIKFNQAFRKDNTEITGLIDDKNPNLWLISSETTTSPNDGIIINENIDNNEKKRFLIGIEVKNAEPGTYIFNLDVRCVESIQDCIEPYDKTHKLYVEVI